MPPDGCEQRAATATVRALVERAALCAQVSPSLRERQWEALRCEGWDALRDSGPVDSGMLPDAAVCGLNGAPVTALNPKP